MSLILLSCRFSTLPASVHCCYPTLPSATLPFDFATKGRLTERRITELLKSGWRITKDGITEQGERTEERITEQRKLQNGENYATMNNKTAKTTKWCKTERQKIQNGE
jgi:hypothetical protein